MKFTVELEIDDGDLARLESATGKTGEALQDVLPKHAQAALTEYVAQYVGRRALSRGTDILEHRLHLLIRHAFDNEVPTEAQVSDLFQTTAAQSRTLIRNTLSRYRFDLATALEATVKATLEAAKPGKGVFLLEIKSAQVLDALKSKLEQEHPGQVPIARTRDASTWTLKPVSYAKLCGSFGATEVSAKAKKK